MAAGSPRDPREPDDFDLTMFNDEPPGLAAYDPNAPRSPGGWDGEMDDESVLFAEADVVDSEPREPDDFDLTMSGAPPGLASPDPNAPRPPGGWDGEMDDESVLFAEADVVDSEPREPDDYDLTMFDDEPPGLAAYDPNAARPPGGWDGEMDNESVLFAEADVVDTEPGQPREPRRNQRPSSPSRRRRLLAALLVVVGVLFVVIATVAVASGPDDGKDQLRVSNNDRVTTTTLDVRAPTPVPLVSLPTTTTTEPPTTTTEAPPPPTSTTSAPRPAPTVVTVAPQSEAEQQPEQPTDTEPPPTTLEPPTTTLDPSTTTSTTSTTSTTTTTAPPNNLNNPS